VLTVLTKFIVADGHTNINFSIIRNRVRQKKLSNLLHKQCADNWKSYE